MNHNIGVAMIRSLPRAPTLFEQHTTGDRVAILEVISVLEQAVNTSDGDLFDSVLSEDVIWGSPKGQIVLGLDQLNPIHRRLAANSRQYGHSSRFTLEAVGFIGANIACASVRRTGLDEHGLPLDPSQAGDSIVQEIALYVLVRQDDRWWIASAQNTPVKIAAPPVEG
jgi:uncharacterized protein (TIGR02246 family)